MQLRKISKAFTVPRIENEIDIATKMIPYQNSISDQTTCRISFENISRAI